MTTMSLRARIENAIKTYNKYRSPEASAKLIDVCEDGSRFTVAFTGSFCKTCGVYDYFEDLIYELIDEANIGTKILEANEEPKIGGYKVTYEIEMPQFRGR